MALADKCRNHHNRTGGCAMYGDAVSAAAGDAGVRGVPTAGCDADRDRLRLRPSQPLNSTQPPLRREPRGPRQVASVCQDQDLPTTQRPQRSWNCSSAKIDRAEGSFFSTYSGAFLSYSQGTPLVWRLSEFFKYFNTFYQIAVHSNVIDSEDLRLLALPARFKKSGGRKVAQHKSTK